VMHDLVQLADQLFAPVYCKKSCTASQGLIPGARLRI
jgi:hypothetical protein